jgi:hypothetical protein
MSYLLICKESDTVREFGDLLELANHAEADFGDVSWQLKRTGRWDSEDRQFVAIESNPPQED